MDVRWTILPAALAAGLLLAPPPTAAPVAATRPAVADTVSADMPPIELVLPRDDREELYRAVLELMARVDELEARVTRLEAQLYVRQSEEPVR